MTVTIVGSQLGDEGKGGAVDLFGGAADVVVRYQGGNNAGHTVVAGGDTYELSLLPSGVVRGTAGVLGNGCVVDPETLFSELDALRERGLDPEVRVAERAHVVLPVHRAFDGAQEAERDDLEVGTTGRGIGPTYEDKVGRRGVRVGDLLDPEGLRERVEYLLERKRDVAADVLGVDPGEAFDVDAVYETYREYGRRLAGEGLAVDCGAYLRERIDRGDRLLFEGAQGTLIDVDHGTYPYVTSSNPTAGAAATGSGLGPTVVGRGEVVGVAKAYLTRVGRGPMPTELDAVEGQTPGDGTATAPDRDPCGERSAGEVATYLREEGGEYGTVTGRPRRVGWLDVPMLRHAARVNGFTGLVVGHVDVLAGLDAVAVGHRYRLDGDRLGSVPSTARRWNRCSVEYRTFEGWPDADWSAVADEGYDALPANAREYVEYVADQVGVDLYAVGVGPAREDTVVLADPFE